MASNKDNEIMDRIMDLNKRRFIPKRRKFTKEEQKEFNAWKEENEYLKA